MTINKKFRLADDIRYTRVLDEAVVVRQDDNEVIIINETSASILDCFQGSAEKTTADLIEHLAAEYDVEIEMLQQDINSHCEELRTAGIIVTTGQQEQS